MTAQDDAPLGEVVGARGFIRHDGSVFGWNVLTGDHRAYHFKHGTSDADFVTRWRLWSPRDTSIDFEDRVTTEQVAAVQAWLDAHKGESLPFDKAEAP